MVNQKAKLIEINNEYAIYDQNARQIAAVREVGQSGLKKAARFLTSLRPVHDPQAADRRHARATCCSRSPGRRSGEVADHRHTTRPATRSARSCSRTRSARSGSALESGGHSYGLDPGRELAGVELRHPATTPAPRSRAITKTWEGLAKTMFTTADNYVVQIHRPLEDPLRLLVVAAALEHRHRAQAGLARLRLIAQGRSRRPAGEVVRGVEVGRVAGDVDLVDEVGTGRAAGPARPRRGRRAPAPRATARAP